MRLFIISMILLLMNLQIFEDNMYLLLSAIGFPFYVFGSQFYFPVIYSLYFIISSFLILIFVIKAKISTRLQIGKKTTGALLIGDLLIIVYLFILSYSSFEFSKTGQYLVDFAILLLALALFNVFMTLKPQKNIVSISTSKSLSIFQQYIFIIGLIVLFAQFQSFEHFFGTQITFIKTKWVYYMLKLFISGFLILIYIKMSNILKRIHDHKLAYKFMLFGIVLYFIYFLNNNFQIINLMNNNYYFSIISQLLLLIGLIQILLNLSAHQLKINKSVEPINYPMGNSSTHFECEE